MGCQAGQQCPHLVTAAGVVVAQTDRNHRDERLVRQRVLLDQVGPQGSAADRQNDVVEGDARGRLDGREPLDRPGLGGAAPGTADRHVEDRPRGADRQSQLLFEQPLLREVRAEGPNPTRDSATFTSSLSREGRGLRLEEDRPLVPQATRIS